MSGIAKVCNYCGCDYSVPNYRASSRFCSRACSDKAPRKRNETRCRECSKMFPRSKSGQSKAAWGSFCSRDCSNTFRSRVTVGSGNPNFKGRNFDRDGYRIYTPQASLKLGLGRMKVHHAVVLTALGIKSLPKGMHVHHRDCDVLNNDATNLALLTNSDHRWLHCQYGTAALSAITKGYVDVAEAASWSDDPLRAASLLVINVEAQAKIGQALMGDEWRNRIPELSCLKAVRVKFIEVDELSDTKRGEGGFGHTG